MQITNNRDSKNILEETSDILNNSWIFQGLSNSVEIPPELFNGGNGEFLNIISDLYFIESINRMEESEEKNDIATSIAEYHKILIFLKNIYNNEVKKSISHLIHNNIEKQSNSMYSDFKNLSSIWDYIFLDSKDDFDSNKTINTILFFYIFLENLYSESPKNNNYKDFSREIANSLNGLVKQVILPAEDNKYIDLICNLTFYIESTNYMFDKLINKCQNSLLFTFTVNDFKDFSKKSFLRTIVKEIKRAVLKNPRLHNILNKDVNCLAIMTFNNKKYIAVNGLDIDDKLNERYNNKKEIITIIIELLKKDSTELKYVEISNKTKYSFAFPTINNDSKKNKGFITYKMYKQFNENNKYKSYNRMFTCCERKLIAEAMKSVNNNSSNLIKLTISMKPCELCKRIIEYTKKTKKVHISINKAKKSSSIKQEKLIEMDTLAQEIYNKYNCTNR